MKLKSYHTATVEAAIRLAYIELGDEAVFLGSRRNDVGNDPNQAYEVTFALMEPGEPPVPPTTTPLKAPPVRNGLGNGQPKNGTPAATPADEGAFLNWKKLLKHVSSKEAKSAEQSQQKSEANGALPNGTLRHWKDFVPGEPLEIAAITPPPASIAAPKAASGVERCNGFVGSGATRIHTNGDGPHGDAKPAAHPVQLVETEKTLDLPVPSPPPASVDRPEGMEQAYTLEKLGAELQELRRMICAYGPTPEQVVSKALPETFNRASERLDPLVDPVYRSLTDNNIEPALAAEIVAQLRSSLPAGADRKRLAALLAREIKGRFKTDSELGAAGSTAIVALVGPSGSGKTTAAAKLAFRSLIRRRRVRLLGVDQLRIGAVEPLQAYAELMNAPVEILDDFDRISKTLQAPTSEGELILIDTPGYGRREWERARRLAAAFSDCGGIEVHLVLDLRMKDEDLRRSIEQYRVFSPAKLIFTRLDETATFGTMLNESVRTGLPLSFVSVGQRVPEDIVPAGEQELLRLLLKDRSAS